MCLGAPGRIVERSLDTPDLARAEIEGVVRDVNLALLEGEDIKPGEWVLVHLGFALERLTEAEAASTTATRRFLFDGEGEIPFAGALLGDSVAPPDDRQVGS